MRGTIRVGALAALAALAALGASGCGDDVTAVGGLAGVESVGRYVLTSIEGQPLPAPYAQNRLHAERVRDGMLTLAEGGRGQWRLTILDAANGRPRQEDAGLSYTVQGDRIVASLDCPAGADCIAPPHLFGRFVARGIVFDSSRVTRAPLVFERVGM